MPVDCFVWDTVAIESVGFAKSVHDQITHDLIILIITYGGCDWGKVRCICANQSNTGVRRHSMLGEWACEREFIEGGGRVALPI